MLNTFPCWWLKTNVLQDRLKDLEVVKWHQGPFMGLWSFFVMDQFSWSRVKPFVNAVSRQVPNLSHLLTKLSPPG